MVAELIPTAQSGRARSAVSGAAARWALPLSSAIECALAREALGAVELGSDCPTEDDLCAFCQGGLPAADLARVDAHLGHCPSCSALVLEVIRQLQGSCAGRPLGAAQASVFEPGTVVAGRYEIRGVLGRGGMGEVYEAFDAVLETRVALKTTRAVDCDSGHAMQRLAAEVQVSRRVQQRNVCRVYDLGVHEDRSFDRARIHFITLELIAGETLGQRLRRTGPLDAAAARVALSATLRGLSALHAAGVVHRDLKSDNVMLTPEDPARAAVIIDLGLARSVDVSSGVCRRGGSGLEGSISYMAPEQLLDEPVGPPADVFAFGVIAFEAVTGRLPYRLGSCSVRRRTESRALSPEDERELGALAPVVMCCLDPQPSRRYQSAADALGALEASLPG